MVVGNLYLKGVAVFPSEADTPLVVDPYAVLALPIAAESLKCERKAGCKFAMKPEYRFVNSCL